jgi:sucrose phosphorylase
MALQVKRYVASRSIALMLRGVPGIYTHGAIALPNDHALVQSTGIKRDVNRGVIDTEVYREHLRQPGSKRSLLRLEQRAMSRARTRLRAFHPRGAMKVLRLSPAVFAVLRTSPEGDGHVLAITNVTAERLEIDVPSAGLGLDDTVWYDHIADERVSGSRDSLPLEMGPYDVTWLQPLRERQAGFRGTR